jgi:hypothetical protein
MSPSFRPAGPRARRRAAALVAAAIVAIAGCGGEPGPSFDPTGPCTVDGSAAGAYPELERFVPEAYEGRGPDLLDSGRNCTDSNLGSLASHGIDEVRFAGGTWEFGSDIAAVLAVFTADSLTADTMAEWWETTARASARTQVIDTSVVDIAGREAHRLDTKTGERLQSVVVWESGDPGRVNVVISHNLPDPKIEAGVEAFGDS